MKMYDVAGIGSALMDLIVEVDYSFLEEIGLKKGSMNLVDELKSRSILRSLERYKLKTAPGGSSANTVAGVSILGGKSVFLGKIGKDKNGYEYEEKTANDGVITRLSKDENAITGHAITFITPDSERTFATHLGAALNFRKEDISEEDIKNSKILHIEGYQLEDEKLREAALYAIDIAKNNNVKVSIDLSDANLIQRNLDLFRSIVKKFADIIFVNEAEAKAFTGKEGEAALNEISKSCKISVVKLGEDGSLIKANDKVYKIPAYKTNVVNTNGAGDMYAAGILYGIANDLSLERAGNIGSYTASLVVAQAEARLNRKIKVRL